MHFACRCAKGSLFDVLHDFSVYIDSKRIIEIAMGIAQGMALLSAAVLRSFFS